jgi:hypothetical protein
MNKNLEKSRQAQKSPQGRFDATEARQILEDLARTGPPSAKVNAIRLLLRLDLEEAEKRGDDELNRWAEQWGDLYPADALERMREVHRQRRGSAA